MASSPNSSNPTSYGSDTTTSTQASTTFVQADPSNFRTIVQRLTGAPASPDDRSPDKLGRHHRNKPTSKIPAFRLHERRQTTSNYNYNNLNLSLNNKHTINGSFLLSPDSTLDFLSASGSSPGNEYRSGSGKEAEEKAMAEKGFYLHPVVRDPPELLPLFPLRSPRDEANSD